ncbi:hypothetical protein CDAR_36971 [Caerostris darwini]|uniref:Lig_chan-Glu_bd domain-containing protein n=1 Tax=Caerostris darwini TaxID=1538125 RepID=A0AAV4QZH9_9ARAC|nr:lig_chan-Glu_bd domain-containing protein [Caerostris darwini]GIY32610.1 hypothetical protein CDAR_36971 [Caerostris darwini]
MQGDMRYAPETDLAGPIFINEQRASVVDFAFPIDFSELVIISGLVPANKNPFLIFKIFSVTAWLLVILAVFIFASTAYLIYTILPTNRKAKKSEAFFKYLWAFEKSFIGKDFGSNTRWFLRHIWFLPSFRLLQSIWFLGCLVLLNVYQGTMVSTYAADRLRPQIESLDDFLKYPDLIIGTYENAYPVMCLQKLVGTRLESVFHRMKKNLIKMDTGIPPWMDSVEQGKAAYISDSMYSKSMIGERFKQTDKCSVRVSTFDFCSGYIGLATRKGLPKAGLRKLDEAILRFSEGRLAQRHMLESVLYYDICSQNVENVRQPLDLMDLLGAFTILVTGLCVSLIFFVLELLMNRAVKKNK